MTHEQTRYPHLLPQDAAVLSAYLKVHGHQYTAVMFDVRVGDGRDPGPNYEPNIRSMALDLSRRRIDMIGYAPEEIHLVEVTTDCGMKILGQLAAYPILYKQSFPTAKPVKVILVTSSIQTDIQPALDALHVRTYVYPGL
jgi:hypothetical protein